MLDNRISLINGYKLIFNENNKYIIEEEIGRGSSCLVYTASYEDELGQKHWVRIKECYPYNVDISRNEKGELIAAFSYEKKFADAKDNFRKGYEKNVFLKRTLGLMNSTVEAVNIFIHNNTLYSVMGCVEGKDYRLDTDENLQSLFKRLSTLCKIIKKYHDKGILHLDIKPENIFLLPETKEHIVLFDFDSLLLKEEIKKNKTVRMAFSDGYSAPELVRGDKNKICEATDVYSIGAIAFYKIFGRRPNIMDGSISCRYNFNLMKKKDERYQPEFFCILNDFLHKTISSSVSYRYQNMDSLIEVLEKLIEVSDVKNKFLYYNFTYHSECFVGREEEMERIKEVFASGKQVLFLSGIGGIGKTELAKRYAYKNMQQYRNIIFVSFTGSIIETVCGNDIRINKIKQEEKESKENYFKRKLEALKSLTIPRDLIILDNFDVDADDNLEKLLECPCRFLITSREDFRDYNYPQIDVEKIEEIEELLVLFKGYNKEKYTQKEIEQIKNIIELVDRHTMTVELIAKYLRMTGDKPKFLLQNLMEKEGITSTEEIGIKHRKDKRLRAESINKHLLALFDLSHFSKAECELIRSLSLLGYIRMKKEKFLKYCPVENCVNELENLIRRGWIEFDEKTHKISLHQIILDLVYNHLSPSSENCPLIVNAMTQYLLEELPNSVEEEVRNKLLDYFIQRIWGNDLAYARFCVYYFRHRYITNEEAYVNLAEKICLNLDDRECHHLLQMIYREKISLIDIDDEIFELSYEESDFDENIFLKEQAVRICKLAEQAYEQARAYTDDYAYLAKFCVDLAMELDEASMKSVYTWDNKTFMNPILDMAVSLFDDAEKYLPKAQMDLSERENLYEQMMDFFSGIRAYECGMLEESIEENQKEIEELLDDNDLGNMYRMNHYIDHERAYRYQQIIDSFEREDDSYRIGMNLIDLAESAENRLEYRKAIDLYYEAYQKGDESYHLAFSSITNLYIKMGDSNNAMKSFKGLLNGKYSQWVNRVCCNLIDLLIFEKKYNEAQKYAEELIQYNIVNIGKTYRIYHLKWLIAANYRLYKLETSQDKKKEYWKNCVTYLSMFPDEEEIPIENIDFLIDFINSLCSDEEKIKKALYYYGKMKNDCSEKMKEKLLDYILKICEEKEQLKSYYVLILLLYSELLVENSFEQDEKVLQYCLKAKEIYESENLKNEYLRSLLHKILGEYYSYTDDLDDETYLKEKAKCNYYYLAEKNAAGKSLKEQIEIWEDAAKQYKYVDNYKMQEKCYCSLLGLLEPILYKYEFSSFDKYWNIAFDQLECYFKLENAKEIKKNTLKLYYKAIEYFFEICEEKEKEQKVDDFRRKLADCAYYLIAADWEREGFIIYIIAIIISIDINQEKGFLYDMEKYVEGDYKILLTVFSQKLHGAISDKNIDDVIGIYERLVPLLKKDSSLHGFSDELKWFSDTYQHQNIEFKR
ncbi:MAG: NB-ARC domain-containing protein [Lachnospiraceae bacterium]